jgi:DNA-binding NarL/FixJ family response regulator
MPHNIILAGVPHAPLNRIEADYYEAESLDDIWELEEQLDIRHQGENTLVVVGKLRPPRGRMVCTITEVAYHLQCISPYTMTVFIGYAEPWVIEELQQHDIKAYINAHHPEELPTVVEQVLQGRLSGQYISPSIDMTCVTPNYRYMNWKQSFVTESFAEGYKADQIQFAASFPKRRSVYSTLENMRDRLEVDENTALITRLIQSGYLLV